MNIESNSRVTKTLINNSENMTILYCLSRGKNEESDRLIAASQFPASELLKNYSSRN